ncbi:MAG: hypothetical protein WBO24_02095 [Nitrospirales bacterium]
MFHDGFATFLDEVLILCVGRLESVCRNVMFVKDEKKGRFKPSSLGWLASPLRDWAFLPLSYPATRWSCRAGQHMVPDHDDETVKGHGNS